MANSYSMGVVLFIFASLVIVNSIFVLKIKNSVAARILGTIFIVMAILSSSYALELFTVDIEEMKVFHLVRNLSALFLAPLFFLLSYAMSKKDSLSKLAVSFLVFVVPLVSIIFAVTSNGHSFFFYNFSIEHNSTFNILKHDTGIWYYFSTIYDMVLYVLTIVIFIKLYFSKNKNRILSVVMMCAISMPLVADAMDFAGLLPYGISLMPAALALSTVFFFVGTVRYRVFHPVPFAHSKVFEWSDNGVLVLDPDLNLLDFNPTAAKLFPYVSRGSIGRNITELFASGDQIKESILSGTECRTITKKEDNTYHFKVGSSSLPGRDNIMIGYMVTFTDITALVKTMKELTELASTDTLTGAQTRRHFSQLAKIEFLRSKRHHHPLSFIMLDVDFFKNINDKYGHRSGDEMLKYVCSLCYENIRSIDLLGRFGGEEFMILLPETNLEGAVIVAKRIRSVIESSTLVFEGNEMNVTVSLGVTGVNCVTDENLDLFLKYADRALYMAKNKGRNKVQVMHLPKIAD